MRSAPLLWWMAERQRIYRARERGEPPPWTRDPILQRYRFTNVFREQDAVTVWFRENIRERLRDSPHALFATILFRWFNRIDTGEHLLRLVRNPITNWNAESVEGCLRQWRPFGPWTTGSYRINGGPGEKLHGVVSCIDRAWQRIAELEDAILEDGTLEGATRILTTVPYLGGFMAYEVACDLRYTAMLELAPDKRTWANVGPGARRGIARLVGWDGEESWPARLLTDEHCVEKMRWLLARARERLPKASPDPAWRRLELREIEHSLCEFDKYERARLGQGRPRRTFVST